MIGYITLGTKDLTRASNYYDELLATIGASRFMEEENYFVAWSRKPDECALSVTLPFDKNEASVGNGTMVAIALDNPIQVDSFYHKALALGGTCEGKPGFRPEGATKGFYAGYFRDLDGNKLNAFCMVE